MNKTLVAFAVIAIAMLLAGCAPKAPVKQEVTEQQPTVSEPAPTPVDNSFDDYSDLNEDPDMGDIEDLPETEMVVP